MKLIIIRVWNYGPLVSFIKIVLIWPLRGPRSWPELSARNYRPGTVWPKLSSLRIHESWFMTVHFVYHNTVRNYRSDESGRFLGGFFKNNVPTIFVTTLSCVPKTELMHSVWNHLNCLQPECPQNWTVLQSRRSLISFSNQIF